MSQPPTEKLWYSDKPPAHQSPPAKGLVRDFTTSDGRRMREVEMPGGGFRYWELAKGAGLDRAADAPLDQRWYDGEGRAVSRESTGDFG